MGLSNFDLSRRRGDAGDAGDAFSAFRENTRRSQAILLSEFSSKTSAWQKLSNKLVKGCSRLVNLHRIDFNRSPTAIELQVKLEIINSRGWDS